ncbi:hypothetical protein [Aquibacillus rhizosphaerae]|uniref:Uncharacterized protein n=1 Tax=Aquibacillus rhizosphaerae TaxID=3051431 RepID=A0ABT7L9D2_9BACI|nr:hypothetical protein [Aquibacillus sp. LR5S19]MDL4842473.1 hypothetical protein [Aquibacillus sp. LR5S19]
MDTNKYLLTNNFIQLYMVNSGGVGLIIPGKVLVDGRGLEEPRNVVLENDNHIGLY